MNPPHQRPSAKPPPDDSEFLEMTPDDVRWVRQQRKQEAHEEWLRGQIKVLWPWVVALVGSLVAAVTWIKDHVRF